MLRAEIKVKNSTHVMNDMSCNWGFGYATKSKELPTKGVRKHFAHLSGVYVKPMLLFWAGVSASLLRLKSFDHTALCSANNNEFVILGFILPKSAWIGGRYSEFRGGRISETFKHSGIWWKNPSAKMRSQFRGGPISREVVRWGPTVHTPWQALKARCIKRVNSFHW